MACVNCPLRAGCAECVRADPVDLRRGRSANTTGLDCSQDKRDKFAVEQPEEIPTMKGPRSGLSGEAGRGVSEASGDATRQGAQIVKDAHVVDVLLSLLAAGTTPAIPAR